MNFQAKIKSKGFTVAQVAAKMKNNRGGIGISQGSLSTALNGNPSIDKLKEVANIIGMSLSELVADGPGTGAGTGNEHAEVVCKCPRCGEPIDVRVVVS